MKGGFVKNSFTEEARKFANELKDEHFLAISLLANVTGTGEEVHVLLEDLSGRLQTHRCFMI